MSAASPIPPSRLAYTLADGALRINPGASDPRSIEKQRKIYADQCDVMGAELFRLMTGLRDPTPLDEALRRHEKGELARGEFEVFFESYTNRAVDEVMVETGFRGMGDRVHAYGFLVEGALRQTEAILRGDGEAWDPSALERLHYHATSRAGLSSVELMTLVMYLEEMRARNRLSILDERGGATCTAFEFGMRLRDRAEQVWKHISGESEYGGSPTAFCKALRDTELPLFQRIVASLRQEHAHVRTELGLGALAPPPTPIVILRVAPIEIAVRRAGEIARIPRSRDEQRPRVAHWSDLALGLDSKRNCYAVTPVPECGARFHKTRSAKLRLSNSAWMPILELAAASDSGTRVAIGDVLPRLGLLPAARTDRDDEASEYADDQAADGGLRGRFDPILERLRITLAHLRHELRNAVDGPRDRNLSLLRIEAHWIETGFTVRYLMEDESGKTVFGSRTRFSA